MKHKKMNKNEIIIKTIEIYRKANKQHKFLASEIPEFFQEVLPAIEFVVTCQIIKNKEKEECIYYSSDVKRWCKLILFGKSNIEWD